jgi:hypothetical protein
MRRADDERARGDRLGCAPAMRRPSPLPAAIAAIFALALVGDAAVAEPIPESPVASDVPLPEHAEDVVDYTLTAKLDPSAHAVHGEGTIRWKNTSDAPVKELWLHLYLNAFKNERSVFMREPIGFRTSVKLKDWGAIDVRKLALHDESGGSIDLWPNAELHRADDEDETDVRLPLPREIASNETITLDVVFDDKLPNVVARTGYAGSFHMVGQWFPKIARLERDGKWAHFPFHKLAEFYADYGTYDVTLDVPESFAVGATGPAVESRVANGRRVERHVQADVHDFAWTAWDQFDSLRETIDGVAVTALFPRGYRKAAQREMAAIRFALPHFGARYGRYPYPTLTLVHPPETAREAGGMEYPTLITTGGRWYEPKWEHALEHVTMHEFGHQYFYGLVGSDEVTWPFLDEGVNEYATDEALRAWLGPGGLGDFSGLSVDASALMAALCARSWQNEKVAQPAYAFQTGNDYGALVYARTAATLETMRRVYGDGLVAQALGRYARKQRFRHPGPDALFASFEEVVGADAAKQLRTALFEKGWVDYVVGSAHADRAEERAGLYDRDGKRESVASGPAADGSFEANVLVFRRGTLAFPVDVELTFADGSTERRRWDGASESTRLSYRGKVALTGVVVDPDHAVIIDNNFTNNHAAPFERSGGGAPRSLERLLYFGELLVQAVAP